MKTKNFMFTLLLTSLLLISSVTKAQIKDNYLGKWNFTAPSAPEGYMNGIIELKPDTAIISFVNMPYSFESNWVKVRNDSLIFNTYVNSEDVLFSLKLEKDNIAGEAVWMDGKTKISLTREAKKD